LVFILVFATFSYAAGEFDKNIIIHNQTRDDKVKSVFKKLMSNYEEENEDGFFSLVSEDRFLQDFMLFEQAIEKDFRTYEILDFDYWIDKITSDGIKRYLYVKWEKRYELINGSDELVQRGYSRFLFDEINGKYKLIELAGNNLWGESLSEWKKEVPHIAGEEREKKGLPDLVIVETCQNNGTFVIKNIGTAGTNSGSIQYKLTQSGISSAGSTTEDEYSADIGPGESSGEIECQEVGGYGGTIEVDPNNLIEESNENNNKVTVNIFEFLAR